MKRWAADLRVWAASLRFSGYTLLIVALVASGAIIISPSLSTYIQQRRELSELRTSVEQSRERVEEIDGARARWHDPAYVRAQARDRLFFVMPGETQLNVIDDIELPVESTEKTEAELTRMDEIWARALVASFITAGTTDEPPPTEPS